MRPSLLRVITTFVILAVVVVGLGAINIWLGVMAMLIAVPLYGSLTS